MSSRGRPVDYPKRVITANASFSKASDTLREKMNEHLEAVQLASKNGQLFQEDLGGCGDYLSSLVNSINMYHMALSRIHERLPVRASIEALTILKQEREEQNRLEIEAIQKRQAEHMRNIEQIEARLRRPEPTANSMFPAYPNIPMRITDVDDSGCEIEDVQGSIGSLSVSD